MTQPSGADTPISDIPRTPPVNVRLHGQDSDGRLAVIEMVVAAAGACRPPPLHPRHAEGFYVLEGELTVQVGDTLMTAGAGTFHFTPRGTPHTFANCSGRDARMLVLCTPAGFETY